MLPTSLLSKGLKTQIPLSFQWLNIAVRLKADSSSSDSSSDSDSDTEKGMQKKKLDKSDANKEICTEAKLTSLLNSMLVNKTPSKRVNVAISQRERRPSMKQYNNQVSFVQQLSAAAEEVARIGGDRKENIKKDLLNKAFGDQETNEMMPMRSSSNIKRVRPANEEETAHWSKNKSIIHELATAQKKKDFSQTGNVKFRRRTDSDSLYKEDTTPLFPPIQNVSSNLSELKTWKVLQEKELSLFVTHTPVNVFREMILWTEQGKLWKFPIDNEQGMEQEQKVHFSEHVFMERHIKDWCPNKGPVRHFMELVCVGLSKNPYLSVQEKIGHLTWYKEYFQNAKDILLDLGAIEKSQLSKETKTIEA